MDDAAVTHRVDAATCGSDGGKWRFSWLASPGRVFYLHERTKEAAESLVAMSRTTFDSCGGFGQGGAMDHVASTVAAIGLAELGAPAMSEPIVREAAASAANRV